MGIRRPNGDRSANGSANVASITLRGISYKMLMSAIRFRKKPHASSQSR